MATAFAEDGIPHRFTTGKVRAAPAASAGPPDAPTAFRVSATLHGVTVKKPVTHAMGRLLEPCALHPLPSVTVTSSWTEPEDPAVNRIPAVPAPDLTVPLAID